MDLNKIDNLLLCPITKDQLVQVASQELAQLNEQICNGKLFHADGSKVQRNLTGALKAKHHALYYPIDRGVFCLLSNLVMVKDFANHFGQDSQFNEVKAQLRKYYDETLWHQEDSGDYKDAIDSEDLRNVSREYIEKCHLRVKDQLPSQGKYLLDVASGPIQYSAYLTYSENFEYRICADLSLQGLLEAKKKLGDKGIYILCDITNLPINDNIIDAVISLHTIYHVPKDEQINAFAQIHRVLKAEGVCVVVYSWGSRSLLMNILMLPNKLLKFVKIKLLNFIGAEDNKNDIYFYVHSYQWVEKEIKLPYSAQILPWRSVNVPFLKFFVHSFLFGESLLKLIYFLEEKAPRLMAKIGAYPMFVMQKK